MKEITITANDANSRFDKYLKKLLVNASGGFIYKMLRKKNITLNGSKADGSELLQEGDCIKLFFSDETFEKFTADASALASEYAYYQGLKAKFPEILYEDDDIILINKGKNLLSQKAKADDISANELMIAYMIQNKMLSLAEFQTFRPSVCNRLDKNTTGLLIFGKSKAGLQQMSLALKERSAHKYYYAVVAGKADEEQKLLGYLSKDEKTNQVKIYKEVRQDADLIQTNYRRLAFQEKANVSLLEIALITGKTHQIRAHLASIGHPIVGDYKYGDAKVNQWAKESYGVKSQLLHAYRLELPGYDPFYAKPPKAFGQLFQDYDF